MRKIAVFLASVAVASGAALTQPIKVDGGMVSGIAGRDSSISVFKGIPFAAPR